MPPCPRPELAARISEYGSEGIVLVPFSLQVMLDGAPLADAEVTLQPEKLMSEAYKPVKATTDDEGLVSFRMESSEFTGVYAGVYRVEVSKKNAQGKETLPSRYNTATTLGQEIAIDVEGIDHAVILKLTSR